MLRTIRSSVKVFNGTDKNKSKTPIKRDQCVNIDNSRIIVVRSGPTSYIMYSIELEGGSGRIPDSLTQKFKIIL